MIALCIQQLKKLHQNTHFLLVDEEQLFDKKSLTVPEAKSLLLVVMTRLNLALKKDSHRTANFAQKWPSIKQSLNADIQKGQEVTFFALLHSDLEFALRDLTVNDINAQEAKDVCIRLADPLVETLNHYWPAHRAASTLMQAVMHTSTARSMLTLNDPNIYRYHYPEMASGMLAIYITLMELYAGFLSGQVPYNVLYIATQMVIENSVGNDDFLRHLASEGVPLSLFVATQMAYDPQVLVFYHAVLSYLFTRSVQVWGPEVVQSSMNTRLGKTTIWLGNQVIKKSTSAWDQLTQKVGLTSCSSENIAQILRGMTSPQLNSYWNAQFLYLGSLWLFNQLLPQEAMAQYVKPRP